MILTEYINKVTGYFTDKRVVEKTGNLLKKLLKIRQSNYGKSVMINVSLREVKS